MDNPFIAALLTVAAEERQRAESKRNQKITNPTAHTWWNTILACMNGELDRDAAEHDGRAEVYERFAAELSGVYPEKLYAYGEDIFAVRETPKYLEQPIPFEFSPTIDFSHRWELFMYLQSPTISAIVDLGLS